MPLAAADLGDGVLEQVSLLDEELDDDARDELAWMGQFVEDMAVAPDEDEQSIL